MRRSTTNWRRKFRQRFTACAVGGSAALSSAACYAAAAFDNASDPVYADGWQAGDNGGTGFTAWNFDTDQPTGIHGIDDPPGAFNNIGRAWDVANDTSGGVTHAGRGFSLAVGETLNVVFDNPSVRQFFKGYFIRINGGTGGVNGNIGYAGAPTTPGGTPKQRFSLSTFEYFTNGNWSVNDLAGGHPTTLFDTDTAAAGALFQFTRTGAETYDFLLDPTGPASSFAISGSFANTAWGSPDWIEFMMFNTPSNSSQATDMYIRSMEIVPEPCISSIVMLGAMSIAGRSRRRRGAAP